VDPPWLQIAARGRARGAVENVAHRRQRHRSRQEGPATEPGGDGVTNAHERDGVASDQRTVVPGRSDTASLAPVLGIWIARLRAAPAHRNDARTISTLLHQVSFVIRCRLGWKATCRAGWPTSLMENLAASVSLARKDKDLTRIDAVRIADLVMVGIVDDRIARTVPISGAADAP
jgi:hypothetical protein